MAMFQPKYAKAQRAAIVSAIVDDDMTAAKARELAAAGELRDGTGAPVAAFNMPLATARTYARHERKRRAELGGGGLEKLDVPTAARSLHRRAVKVLDAEMRRLENQRERTAQQHAERIECVHRIARAMNEVRKLDAEQPGRPSRNGRGDGQAKAPPRDREAEALAREARTRAAEHAGPTLPLPPTGSRDVAAGASSASEGASAGEDGGLEGGPNMALDPEAERPSGQSVGG